MMVVIALVFGLSVSAMASSREPLALVQTYSETNDWEFQLHFGLAWYHDHRPTDRALNHDFPSTDDLAVYVQVPIVSVWDRVYLSFGGVFPVSYIGRSRPSFALDTKPSLWCEKWPQWANVEVGAYVLASPWNAWGAQVGLINLRF